LNLMFGMNWAVWDIVHTMHLHLAQISFNTVRCISCTFGKSVKLSI
jgi:hypothetical protein